MVSKGDFSIDSKISLGLNKYRTKVKTYDAETISVFFMLKIRFKNRWSSKFNLGLGNVCHIIVDGIKYEQILDCNL